jgi:hypothetical protein
MDPAVVAAHSSPEGSLAITGGAPAVGRDAITAVAASFYEALPDTQVYLRDLVVDGIRIEYGMPMPPGPVFVPVNGFAEDV